MSETDDHESKTEEPTEKKIEDALEKGRVPVSRELGAAAGFLSFLLALSFVADDASARLTQSLGLLLENAGDVPLRNGADALKYHTYVALQAASFLAPMLGLSVALGLAASFAQGAPRFVFARVAPDMTRVSPVEGWRRLFGLHGVMELVKASIKLAIVGGGLAFCLEIDKGVIRDAMRSDPATIPSLAKALLIHLVSVLGLMAGGLGALDFAWTKIKWRRDMRMSRQELKEEVKESEGDAFVKARMRSLAQSRARKRMMASVPRATLILANPTHYAIALRYRREEGGAPLVVAKGKDLLALKIREIGEENGIPMLERRELVRAMYDHVEVNQMIPQEFFRPIAELIHFINSRGARR